MDLVNPGLFAAFLVAVVVLVLVPGPDMLFIIAVGVHGGPAAGFVAAIGVAVGLIIHAIVAALGLTALFHTVPLAYDVLRIAGGMYLLWLGVRAFLAHQVPAPPSPVALQTRRVFGRALLTNLLNPKVILFNAAFLPQFVDPARGHVGLQFAILGACFVAIDFAIDGPVGLLAGRFGRWLTQRRSTTRAVNVFAGAVFVGLASWLLLDGQSR
jgi:threonine/homoserine/homoserine lactone efflux protein